MTKRILVATLLLPSLLWGRNKAGDADGSDWREYSQSYKVGWIRSRSAWTRFRASAIRSARVALKSASTSID